MAIWQRKLRVWPEWDQASKGEITVQELAATIATRLRALTPFLGEDAYLNDERDEIADDFEGIATDAETDEDDFAEVMHRLYDWADTQIGGQFFDARKVCWVYLFTSAEAAP